MGFSEEAAFGIGERQHVKGKMELSWFLMSLYLLGPIKVLAVAVISAAVGVGFTRQFWTGVGHFSLLG